MRRLVAALVLACICSSAFAAHVDAHVRLLKNREYREALQSRLRSANRSILLSCYLFRLGRGRQTWGIADELVKARRRGVDVRVIFERGGGRDSLDGENRRAAAVLAAGGVKVTFDSPAVVSHAKVAVIDGRYVFIGSHNLTAAALSHNNELSVEIDSPEMAAEVASWIGKM